MHKLRLIRVGRFEAVCVHICIKASVEKELALHSHLLCIHTCIRIRTRTPFALHVHSTRTFILTCFASALAHGWLAFPRRAWMVVSTNGHTFFFACTDSRLPVR